MKPGWKTTEFWLSLLAVIVGAFLASGLLAETHIAMKIAAFVGMVLNALGYTFSRAAVKRGELKAPDDGGAP